MRKYLLLSLVISANAYSTEPIPRHEITNYDQEQIDCIAKNMFFEVRGENIESYIENFILVEQRLNDDRFKSDSYCAVIQAGYKPDSESCAFSWFCDNKPDDIPDNIIEKQKYEELEDLALSLYLNEIEPVSKFCEADHYHRYDVNPYWADHEHYHYVGEQGSHLFYTWNETEPTCKIPKTLRPLRQS